MALTLTEGNKYSTTELDRKVIDLLTKDSEVLSNLPFEEILGNSLTYDMITTRSGAGFYDVGDTWVESTPVITQDTVVLKRLGGDADVDNFILKTRSNKIDVKGQVLADKVLAVKEAFLDNFWYGTFIDAKGFEGMHELLTSTTYNTKQSATANGDGAAGSSYSLQEAIDLIHEYKPTHMFMTKLMRRRINVYLDSIGEKFTTVRDNYGKLIEYFRGIQIEVDEHLLDTESTTDAGAFESYGDDDQATIFVISFASQACCGVQGPDSIETIPIGDLETKDAQRWRVRWYCGLKFEHLRSCSKYCGILTGSSWAA